MELLNRKVFLLEKKWKVPKPLVRNFCNVLQCRMIVLVQSSSGFLPLAILLRKFADFFSFTKKIVDYLTVLFKIFKVLLIGQEAIRLNYIYLLTYSRDWFSQHRDTWRTKRLGFFFFCKIRMNKRFGVRGGLFVLIKFEHLFFLGKSGKYSEI